MKVFPILALNINERTRMTHLLRSALKRNLLENSVLVAVSPENELVLHVILDSSLTKEQVEKVNAMVKNIRVFMAKQDAKKYRAEQANNVPFTLPNKQIVYASRFGLSYRDKTWDQYH